MKILLLDPVTARYVSSVDSPHPYRLPAAVEKNGKLLLVPPFTSIVKTDPFWFTVTSLFVPERWRARSPQKMLLPLSKCRVSSVCQL